MDLGSFLGESTVALAEGLGQNDTVSSLDERVHAYDLFRWQAWMESPVQGTRFEGKYAIGDSFLPAFVEQVSPWRRYIRVYEGDLSSIGWTVNRPIEYLFVDAMKNWHLCNEILRKFFVHLKPGRSFVHHQDFAHFHTYWIHLITHRFREFLVPVDHGYLWSSRVFLLRKPIPSGMLDGEWALSHFTIDECNDAFDYSIEICDDRCKPNILAALAKLYLDKGEIDMAKVTVERAARGGEKSEASIVRSMIDSAVSR